MSLLLVQNSAILESSGPSESGRLWERPKKPWRRRPYRRLAHDQIGVKRLVLDGRAFRLLDGRGQPLEREAAKLGDARAHRRQRRIRVAADRDVVEAGERDV